MDEVHAVSHAESCRDPDPHVRGVWPRRATGWTIKWVSRFPPPHTVTSRWPIWFKPRQNESPHILSSVWVNTVTLHWINTSCGAFRCSLFAVQLDTQQSALTHRRISCHSLCKTFCQLKIKYFFLQENLDCWINLLEQSCYNNHTLWLFCWVLSNSIS